MDPSPPKEKAADDPTRALPEMREMVTFYAEPPCLLTVNGGSSSLKFAAVAIDQDRPSRPLLKGRVERIGLADPRATVEAPPGSAPDRADVDAPDLRAAADWLIDWLERRLGTSAIAGIAHRLVHGGSKFVGPVRIDRDVLDELRRLCPLDPDHLPGEIAAIERFGERWPHLPQVACFDTAFHHEMPRVARILPIPRRFEAAGVRRYGFHGLSYSYLMGALTAAEPAAALGRVILAHLGNGASLAAVHAGRPIDTTMALTPAAGVPMGTRSGDIDPGLPGFLARTAGLTTEQFDAMMNKESGLLGISETSADVRDLLACRGRDTRAAEAIDVFVYQLKKAVGALAAALGGLDVLVFSGGIGEHSAEIRAAICEGLAFLGVVLDGTANRSSAPLISAPGGRVQVRVIPTDEESWMASEACRVLAAPA